MKYFIDVIKIVLLAVISFFLYQNGQELPLVEKESQQIVNKPSEHKKGSELKKIMEHPIRQVFKFPEDVKFSYVVFEEKGVYSDIGINLPDPADDIISAKMCGFYSAKSGMGAYGSPRKFYAIAAIDNRSKDIDGDFWLVNDEEEVKKTLSLTSSYLLSDKKFDFDKNWSDLCGNDKRKFLGKYENYKTESALFYAQYIEESLGYKMKKNKEMLGMVNKCTSKGGELQSCIFSSQCMLDESFSKENKKNCEIVTNVCSDSEQVCSEENIDKLLEKQEEKK